MGEASYIEGTFFSFNEKWIWSVFNKYTLSFLVASAPGLRLAGEAELYLASMCGNLPYKNDTPFPTIFGLGELAVGDIW